MHPRAYLPIGMARFAGSSVTYGSVPVSPHSSQQRPQPHAAHLPSHNTEINLLALTRQHNKHLSHIGTGVKPAKDPCRLQYMFVPGNSTDAAIVDIAELCMGPSHSLRRMKQAWQDSCAIPSAETTYAKPPAMAGCSEQMMLWCRHTSSCHANSC